MSLQLATGYQQIIAQLDAIDPVRYGKSRNFTNGAVTQLSPYIARGVIDTKTVFDHLVNRGFNYIQLEKFVQQLCWREYFQRVWQLKGEGINQDIKQQQEKVEHRSLPLVLTQAATGIEAVDRGINQLRHTGMMHNHLRMYTAFLACNAGRAHWMAPAKWMYYHLLDGDWASNALSWQWVAGTFSSKKYIANQENINHYARSNQRGTYIDLSYEELAEIEMPSLWRDTLAPAFTTPMPQSDALMLDASLPLFIYNYYNLSPTWRSEESANRVLLLEPDQFAQYPVAEHCMAFVLALAKNIPNIQVFVGSFEDLQRSYAGSTVCFKEHPLNRHYKGQADPRNWILDGVEANGSFFSFWKKNESKIRKMLK
jgi:deoxyribodipyrimidine photo-lyase